MGLRSLSYSIDGIQIILESNGLEVSNQSFDLVDLLTINAVDIYISVNPALSSAQVFISIDGGSTVTAVGSALVLPASFLNSDDGFGMAAGIVSSSSGAVPFSVAWDFLNVTDDQPGVIETMSLIHLYSFFLVLSSKNPCLDHTPLK